MTNPYAGDSTLPGSPGLPRLDTHAHLAPDVTPAQVAALGECHVFAVTRTLEEAAHVKAHPAPTLTWGIGVHPGLTASRDSFDARAFVRLLPAFGLVGEIGLDQQAGRLPQQIAILRHILRICADQPVLLSVHSSGQSAALLELLAEHPHPGVILHWWRSTTHELETALETGAYFSVNAAMEPMVLSSIPLARVVTETDFPAGRTGARMPGDTDSIEGQLAAIHDLSPIEIRHRLWVNLRRLVIRAEALDRLAEPLVDRLLSL